MSEPAAHTTSGAWDRLPARLRPRDREVAGSGNQWLVETTLLLVVGLVLAIATINDVARQTGINNRLIADLHSWRSYTHHDYHNVGVDTELLGTSTKRDVTCGNDTPGPPKARTQICLVTTGPTHDGRRMVAGGWYLPPYTEDDVRERRYSCFGSVTAGLCAR